MERWACGVFWTSNAFIDEQLVGQENRGMENTIFSS